MQRAVLAGVAACVLACGGAIGVTGGVMPVTSAAMQQGGVSFVPSLSVGQTMAYDAEWTAVISQSVGEGADATRQAQRILNKAELRFEVLEVGPDGRARVKAMVPSVSMMHRAGDESRQFEHPLPEDTAVIGVAWSGLGERLSRMEITFEVDAAGQVGRVSGLEPFVNACREASPDLDLTGMFTPAQFTATVQGMFDAGGARGEQRNVGDSWDISQTTPLGAAGVLDITDTWRFVTVEEGIATLVATPELSLRRPTNPQPNTPTVALGDSTGFTRIGWNVEAEKLQARESMLRMTTTWGAGDVQIVQTQSVTTKLTAK